MKIAEIKMIRQERWYEYRKRFAICGTALWQRFTVPKDTQTIWVSLHDTRGRNRWPVSIRRSWMRAHVVIHSQEGLREECVSEMVLDTLLCRLSRQHGEKTLYAQVEYEE